MVYIFSNLLLELVQKNLKMQRNPNEQMNTQNIPTEQTTKPRVGYSLIKPRNDLTNLSKK